ncbi:MAG: SURF1 family protein [Pseudomonadota bacterium]
MQGKTRYALVACLMFLSVTVLGTQQEMLMKEEAARVAQIKSLMREPPVPMPEKIDSPAAWAYRRVTLAGHFLYDHEFLMKPRILGGVSGYHMLVPFQRASGGIVMVNRGWISDAEMPKADRPGGTIMIEGIVQAPHALPSMPPNDPQKNIWRWADVNAMAAAGKLEAPSPVIVVVSGRTPGVYPAGGMVEINIRSDYGARAVFWYVLALILLAGFFVRHLRKSPSA